MSVERYKNILLELQQDDYESFVQAMIAIEYHIDDKACLQYCYESFMLRDSMSLLDPSFEAVIEQCYQSK